jgi:hypothetical protein
MLTTEKGTWCPACGQASGQPTLARIPAGPGSSLAHQKYPALLLLVKIYRILAVVVGIVGGILTVISLGAGVLPFAMSALWTVLAVTGLIAVSEAINLAIRIEQNTFETRQNLERMVKQQTP